MKIHPSRSLLPISVLAAGALCAGVTWVAFHRQSQAKVNAKPASASSMAGSVVFVDPTTKQIRQPSAEEIGALTSTTGGGGSIAQPPRIIPGPGGGNGLVLGPEHEVAMVVTKGPDGKLKMDCVTGSENAAAVAEGRSAVAGKESHHEH